MDFFWYPFEVIVCDLEAISNEPSDKIIFEHANYEWVKIVYKIFGRDEEQSWSNLEEWEFEQPIKLSKLYSDSFGSTNAPSVVIQHAQPARTFVMISAQGTHIVSKLR